MTRTTALSGVRRHALVYGFGTLASKAVSFIMLPVYTRVLTPADYGVMELIGLTLDVISIIGGAQLAHGIFRFYHKAEDERDRHRVVSTALFGLGLSYGAVGLVTLLASDLIARLVFGDATNGELIRLAALTLGLQGVATVASTYARLQEFSTLVVASNLVRLVLQLGCNILFVVVLRIGVAGVFWSNLIATAIVTVAMTVWVMGRVGAGIDRQALGSLTRYGLPLVATNVATFFVAFGDRYFIEATHGTAEVGRYSLAYQFGFLLASIGYAPFTAVWDSRRFAIALDPDRDALYSRAFLGMNLWLIPMAVGMGLFAPEVLRVMTTPDYFMPPAVIVFILVSYILQGWTHIHEIGILLAEKTRYVAVANWIAAGVAAIAYALLIPPLGGLGAAVATIIAMSARFTAVYVYSQRLTPISWRWGPSLRLAGIAAAAMAVGAVLPMMTIGPSFALRGTTFVAFAVAVWLAPDVLGERERAIVRLAFRSPQQALAALRG